jgi:hypothetical protein
LPNNLLENIDIAKIAFSINGNLIKHSNEVLRSNREIVKLAVSNNPKSLK